MTRWGRDVEIPCEPDFSDAALDRVSLQDALHRLHHEERRAVLLTQAGYTQDEIGRLLGISPTTVRRRYASGLQNLRKLLEEVA